MAYIELEIEGQTQKYEYDESIQGDVVYDLTNDTVGIIRESKIHEFEEYIKWNEKFKKHIAVFLKPEEDKKKEEERKYKLRAVMCLFDEFHDAIDNPDLSKQILDQLDERIDNKVQQFKDDDALYKEVCANGHKLKNGDILEVYWTKGKKMVRIWNKQAKGITIWYPRSDVEFQIKKEVEENKRKPKKIAKEAEIKIFERKFWEEEGSFTEDIEEFNKKCNYELFKENRNLDLNIGAQFLRYSSEAAYGANINWSEEKTIKIGAKAEGSFALAQAQGNFSVHLPNEDGFGLMQYFKEVAPQFVKDDYTEIFMKVSLTTTGSAFIGACASASLDLGISLAEKEEDKNDPSKKIGGETFAGAQAGFELFAGAKTQAEAKLSVDTMFVEDEKLDEVRAKTKTIKERGKEPLSSKGLGEWKSLGDATLGGYVALGAGIDVSFRCGYIKNIGFGYHAKIGAVVKAGAGVFVKGTVNTELIGKFILTVVNGFNWSNISDKLVGDTYKFYQGLMANCFYTGKKVDEIYQQFAGNIDAILLNISNVTLYGYGPIKAMDDMADEFLPGYSSFKQYNLGFIVLKDTYEYLKELNKDLEEKEAAIQAVEKAQQNKIRWYYATWQMKVNLIYDMRHGGSGWFGGFSEERKEDAVIAVLESSRNKEEFWKIVDSLETPKEDVPRDSLNLDELVDFSQQDRLNYLRNIKYR